MAGVTPKLVRIHSSAPRAMETPDPRYDPTRIGLRQRKQFRQALARSLWLIALMGAGFVASLAYPGLRDWGVLPGAFAGLPGIVLAPLLHADMGHLLGNASALLILGTTLGTVYPRSALRIVASAWIFAGVFTWLIGRPAVHIGASGLTHGLFFALFLLGAVRGDRPARVAGGIALMLFGGMALSVLPGEWRTSWEMHAGGALGGLFAAAWWRALDPPPTRAPYSWEIEEEFAGGSRAPDSETLEPPRPREVPVLWVERTPERGVVLPFRRGPRDAPPPQ